MGILKACLKSFKTMEEASIYYERCKLKWGSHIEIIKNDDMEMYDVYISESIGLMDCNFEIRIDEFFQAYYFTFTDEFYAALKNEKDEEDK